MCQIRSSLLSLLGCERGWIASPGASRSAERRDTSAMVFVDSLQTSHIRHGPEQAIMAWPCKTKHWKEIPVCCNLKPNMKPKMIKMCLLQLCSFFIGDFGLQNVFFEINSATMDLTHLTHQSSAFLLGARTCSKSGRACVLDLSSKSLWSSLVSCEDTSQARNQSMAACSKSKHDQIPH